MFKLVGLFVLVLSASVSWGLPQPETFITNGNNAYAGQFPYYASVVEKFPLLKEQIRCGGAIINKEWILTSGQCVKPLLGKLSVKVGQSSRNKDSEYVQKRSVKFVLINDDITPGLRPSIKENDIALLKLETPLLLNERVQTIKLAEDECEPSEKVVLTGFGTINSGISIPKFPKELQYAEVEVISEGLCRDAISSISPVNEGLLTDTQLCTGPLDKAVTACLGDLGNPLVRRDKEGKPELVGITSWSAIPCGQKGAPIVYTKVSSFGYWIKERIRENSNSSENSSENISENSSEE